VEALPRSMFRVELSNGHRVLAHLKRGTRTNAVEFETGKKVMLEMSPFDLSTGRVICNEK